MPTVPQNSVADPFSNRISGKAQDRPPQSPLPRMQVRDSIHMPNLASLNPSLVLMAAASMHEQGRLFQAAAEDK